MPNQSSLKEGYDVPEPKIWYDWTDGMSYDYVKALNALLDMSL